MRRRRVTRAIETATVLRKYNSPTQKYRPANTAIAALIQLLIGLSWAAYIHLTLSRTTQCRTIYHIYHNITPSHNPSYWSANFGKDTHYTPHLNHTHHNHRTRIKKRIIILYYISLYHSDSGVFKEGRSTGRIPFAIFGRIYLAFIYEQEARMSFWGLTTLEKGRGMKKEESLVRRNVEEIYRYNGTRGRIVRKNVAS